MVVEPHIPLQKLKGGGQFPSHQHTPRAWPRDITGLITWPFLGSETCERGIAVRRSIWVKGLLVGIMYLWYLCHVWPPKHVISATDLWVCLTVFLSGLANFPPI